jgi:hypothetical protein
MSGGRYARKVGVAAACENKNIPDVRPVFQKSEFRAPGMRQTLTADTARLRLPFDKRRLAARLGRAA